LTDESKPPIEMQDLRGLIQKGRGHRFAGLGARSMVKQSSASRPGLRERMFQRFLSDLESFGPGQLDRTRMRRIIESSPESLSLPEEWIDRLEQELIDEAEGLGPIAPLLRDPTISDVLVNGPGEVWVDRFGRLERSQIRFDDDNHLRRLLRRIVASRGRRLDEASPHVDVRLADGSRLNAVLPPVSLRGPVVSIRRARTTPFRLEELIAFGTLTREMGRMLEQAVRARRSIVVSGGAGAGKTTMLNVLSRAIPTGERIVTIEETAELRLEHPHVVALEGRMANAEGVGEISLRTLVKNALRMRADRIIVGEVRGSEAFDMLQAMNVGHDGSMTTVHSNSARDAVRRLQSLVLMGGGDLPAATVNELIGSAIEIIVQLARYPDGTRRVESIARVGLANNELYVRELFIHRTDRGGFEATTELREFLAEMNDDSTKERFE